MDTLTKCCLRCIQITTKTGYDFIRHVSLLSPLLKDNIIIAPISSSIPYEGVTTISATGLLINKSSWIWHDNVMSVLFMYSVLNGHLEESLQHWDVRGQHIRNLMNFKHGHLYGAWITWDRYEAPEIINSDACHFKYTRRRIWTGLGKDGTLICEGDEVFGDH